MKTIKMSVNTSHCMVGVVNGEIQSLLDIQEYADVPCIKIHATPLVLGNRGLQRIAYVIPKRLEYNTPLMIENN